MGGERGSGKLSLIFIVVALGIGSYVGIKLAGPYWHKATLVKDLKEAIKEGIRYMSPSDTEELVRQKLEEWGVKYDFQNLFVWDEEGFRHVKFIYTEKVVLFGRWEVIYTFEPEIKVSLR